MDAALFFLGGIEQARHLWVIECDAPARLCMLSRYGEWQDIVYRELMARPGALPGIFGRRSEPQGTVVHDGRPLRTRRISNLPAHAASRLGARHVAVGPCGQGGAGAATCAIGI
jgi:hypothetical protein